MNRPPSARPAVLGIVSGIALLIAGMAAAAPVAEPADESHDSLRPALEPEHDPCREEDAECAAAARQARDGLAARLAVPPERIELLLAARITWRDGSLGCPRPDRLYTQALVPGMLIELRAAGATYRYHAREHGEPFLCEQREADQDDDAGHR